MNHWTNLLKNIETESMCQASWSPPKSENSKGSLLIAFIFWDKVPFEYRSVVIVIKKRQTESS